PHRDGAGVEQGADHPQHGQGPEDRGGNRQVDRGADYPSLPSQDRDQASCDKAVGAIPGVTKVEVDFTANVQQGRSQIKDNLIPTVKNTIAVSSGKGGVGKTTVAVNLAAGLALQGAKVGLMDADVYGPNVPMMMGVERPPEQQDGKLLPAESHGVKLISMGFFVPDDQ